MTPFELGAFVFSVIVALAFGLLVTAVMLSVAYAIARIVFHRVIEWAKSE